MTADRPAGLALERTRLAWRRTALGLAAGSVAAGRLLQDVVGPASWLVAAAGLTASALVTRAAWRRLVGPPRPRAPRHAPDGPTDPHVATGLSPAQAQGGGLVGVVAAGTALVGVAALVVVLAG
ncbi:DUF202 domain-containing protein [Cellulomonas persica]|uniref:DUF202 domain-containing protein n=1 Tax=Cellulomonas persica TaxID=76861 RepID=A0A510UPJ2_9CELL|nr:DUF202 domain-containing protein [Cellulomonas persica]GEK16583.1 hypothetical protein CPE01_03160 [Cellulomonas persica]